MIITVSELRDLNRKNGGNFFNPRIMKLAHENIRSFRLEPAENSEEIILRKKVPGNNPAYWIFNQKTGLLSYSTPT